MDLRKYYPHIKLESPVKILFLDIDGVLNSEEFFSVRENRLSRKQISDVLTQKLNKLSGVQVVISSSWNYNENTVSTLRNSGLTLPIISGVNPSYTPYGERGKYIKRWLDTFCTDIDFEYAIVDDDDDMLKEQHEHFVQTDAYYGLTDNDLIRLKQILKIE